MKFYIPFGDWSDDGHGRCINVLVEAPSMELLLKAQQDIKADYGENFFYGFADTYEEPNLRDIHLKALKDIGYNFSRLDDVDKPEELLEYISLDNVTILFIDLLNAYGAQITREEDYPQICNWTCPGFETVGYGCFY